ncbi:hypothetical protein DdX_21824 [Ditylenchus destructor]|uniref:Insulin-like domain-containing protein n=1 Tax=Ditylenchus destructor TaxID=166010 RepID=A0AAD4MGP3_9BILA|nr:hypothetical protein DdX_21824 [Ditylenchus destructor]
MQFDKANTLLLASHHQPCTSARPNNQVQAEFFAQCSIDLIKSCPTAINTSRNRFYSQLAAHSSTHIFRTPNWSATLFVFFAIFMCFHSSMAEEDVQLTTEATTIDPLMRRKMCGVLLVRTVKNICDNTNCPTTPAEPEVTVETLRSKRTSTHPYRDFAFDCCTNGCSQKQIEGYCCNEASGSLPPSALKSNVEHEDYSGGNPHYNSYVISPLDGEQLDGFSSASPYKPSGNTIAGGLEEHLGAAPAPHRRRHRRRHHHHTHGSTHTEALGPRFEQLKKRLLAHKALDDALNF